jgi:hypothetical protein
VVAGQAFLRLFPQHGWFIEALSIQHRLNWLSHLRAILDLADVYPQEALLQALATARTYNTYSHHFIRGLLESGGWQRVPDPSLIPLDHLLPPCTPVSADLDVYQRILEAVG